MISRTWARPNAQTYQIPQVKDLIDGHLSFPSADPFSVQSTIATHTNDLNPLSPAIHHLDALEFLGNLLNEGVKLETVLFDPPYSLRQCAEMYKSVGKPVTMRDT